MGAAGMSQRSESCCQGSGVGRAEPCGGYGGLCGWSWIVVVGDLVLPGIAVGWAGAKAISACVRN
jgi:hypothetical protein